MKPVVPMLTLVMVVAPRAWAVSADVIYVGAPASPELGAQVGQMAALLRSGPPVLTPAEHLDEWLEGGRLTVLGATETHLCEGPSRDAAEYTELLDEFYRAIWETENLDPLLQQLHSAQVCLSEPVEAHHLARVAFLDGVMAYELGDIPRAHAAMAEALTLDPSYVYEGDFGPPAGRLFEEIRGTLAASQRLPIEIAGVSATRLWVDGALADGLTSEVTPGRHLIQVADGVGAVWTAAVVVTRPVTVVDPRGVEYATAETVATVVGALLRGLQRQGEAPGWFVALGEPTRAWQWDGQALNEVRITRPALQALAPPDNDRKKGLKPPAAVLLTSGIGLAVAGAIVSVATNVDLAAFNKAVDDGDIAFPEDTDTDRESHPNYIKWQEKSSRVYVGYGLLGAGGVCILVSIPVQHLSGRTQQHVALSLQPLASPVPGGFQLEGLHVSINLF